jgi:hypothetical protein
MMSKDEAEVFQILCPIHGERPPAIICQHLKWGNGLGFFTHNDDCPVFPWLNQAWCRQCNELLEGHGEWNDINEQHADFIFVCDTCYKEIEKANGN